MSLSKTVLVVLRAHEQETIALERGRLIAERLHCRLAVLVAGTEAQRLERQAWLESELAAFSAAGQDICIEADADPDLADAVLRAQSRLQAGLVVKECDPRHSQLSWRAPADWQLLRQCPCPVLLVKRDIRWQGGKVLAAIEGQPQSERHRLLNQGILQLAALVTRSIEGQLHLVSAFPPPLQGGNPDELTAQQLESQWRQACIGQSASLVPAPAVMHIGEGPAEHWIPKIAGEDSYAVVVLGTVARSQFIGALLGNTAERILDAIHSDVLVLQPDNGEAALTLLEG
ncbi:hypothetical protein WH50_01290 [Pokkaliibacter plantistimulans]|uniref:UspA domain-containing protein n=1 Tax=Pokkaliibacter plantistimulans TaxID=1635171 RepID=A0ABX5M5R0_9GAMM|nr:universal stress protein [Pokkaliibacter plantistimulans]PXF33018.1 hypothetical protein WH50_01290 [Pokkaliibacter plantistimulans]